MFSFLFSLFFSAEVLIIYLLNILKEVLKFLTPAHPTCITYANFKKSVFPNLSSETFIFNVQQQPHLY